MQEMTGTQKLWYRKGIITSELLEGKKDNSQLSFGKVWYQMSIY